MVLPISFFEQESSSLCMHAPTQFFFVMQNNMNNNIDESSFEVTLRSTFPTD